MKYCGVFLLASLFMPIAHAGCPAADSLIRTYGISPAGFDKPLPKSEPQDKNKSSNPDIVVLSLWRNQPIVHDGFQHSAWINRKTKQAWIIRTGGFVGVREWYGPITVENLDLSGCQTEPAMTAKQTSAR